MQVSQGLVWFVFFPGPLAARFALQCKLASCLFSGFYFLIPLPNMARSKQNSTLSGMNEGFPNILYFVYKISDESCLISINTAERTFTQSGSCIEHWIWDSVLNQS